MGPTLRITEPLNDSTGFYLDASALVAEWQTAHHRLEIFDTQHFGRVLRVDVRNFVSEREEFIGHENLVHPALTAHMAPRRVLVLGGGDGGKGDDRHGDHDTDHRASSTSATAGTWRRRHSVRSAAAVDNRRAKRAGHTATRLAISKTPATTAAMAATG